MLHPYLYGIVNDILPLPFEKSKNNWHKCKKIPDRNMDSLPRTHKKRLVFRKNAIPSNIFNGLLRKN